MVYARNGGDVDADVWLWHRGNNDPRPDVHRPARQLCAPAAALSGMAQSIGYLLAACGPPLMGKIHDTAGDWQIPLLGCALAAVIMAICGVLAGRDREIAPR